MSSSPRGVPTIIALARCEGVTAAGKQCKCYGEQKVNEIWYCEQHAKKALAEALAMKPHAEEGR